MISITVLVITLIKQIVHETLIMLLEMMKTKLNLERFNIFLKGTQHAA